MQKARIRTGWKNRNRVIDVEEFANALSSICWRISLNAAKNLHQQDFDYSDDNQRIGVIEAYLHFLVHCSDRLMSEHLDQDQRYRFITALANDCCRHYQENAEEIQERIVDRNDFIERMNSSSSHYSETRFSETGPGYDMLRLLGSSIQEIMGHSQTNKWIIDQIMDIDGPEAYDIFSSSFGKLKKSSGY